MSADIAVPLLLDTDIGDDVDDVFALLLAARHPGIKLLGVSTVYGDVAQRTRIARKLLRLAGRADIPVVTGLGPTLSGREPAVTMTSGAGFAPEVEPGGGGADSGAVDYLMEQVMTSHQPVTLVAIGPLTNVGAAVRQEPRFAARLHSLVVMGGRIGENAQRGEHNFNCDPEATRLVLECGARLRIGEFNATVQARLGYAAAQRLQSGDDPACIAAAEMLETYLRQLTRAETAMYDPLTLSLAYTEQYLQMQPMSLTATYAQQLVTLEARSDATASTELSVGAAGDAFVEHLLEIITGGALG